MQEQEYFETNTPTGEINFLEILIKECVHAEDAIKVGVLANAGVSTKDIESVAKFNSTSLKEKFRRELDAQRQTDQNRFNLTTSYDGSYTISQHLKSEFEAVLNFTSSLKYEIADLSAFFSLVSSMNGLLYAELKPKDEKLKDDFEVFFLQAQIILEGEICSKDKQLINDLKNMIPTMYKSYGFENDKRETKYHESLKLLPLYSKYKQYLGKNIDNIRTNFCLYMLKYLKENHTVFSPETIKEILENIMKNPLWNFQSSIKLTNEQKKMLYQVCWKEDQIKHYALVWAHPKSLKYKVSEVVEKMMDLLIAKQRIQKSRYLEVIQAIEEFDPIKFYSISTIANFRSEVIIDFNKVLAEVFTDKQGQYFFYFREINGGKCKEMAKIDLIMKIRKFLFENNVESSLYQIIETNLLENNLLDLWKLPISMELRRNIVNFYEDEDTKNNYRRILLGIVPMEIKVRAELEEMLLKLDFKNLTFNDIRDMATEYINTKVLPISKITQAQDEKFVEVEKSSKFSKSYIEGFKLDKEMATINLKQRIIYICSQATSSISEENVRQIIDQLLKQVNLSSIIYDSENLTLSQKNFLFKNINETEEFVIFTDTLKKENSMKNKEALYQSLENSFGRNGRKLGEYYERNRTIRFNEQKRIIPENQLSKEITNILGDRYQEIQNIETQSIQYRMFNQSYDFLNGERKKELEERMLIAIKKIIYDFRISNSNEIITELRDENFNFEILPEQIKSPLENQKIYKEYVHLVETESRNEHVRKRCELDRFILSLEFHPTLRKYSPKERNDVVQGILKQGSNFKDFLLKTPLLTPLDKEAITNLILDSSEWKNCFSIPTAPVSSNSPQKPKSLEELKSEFIKQLRVRCQFPNEISDDIIKSKIDKNLYENVKNFITGVGIKGIAKVNKIETAIMGARQYLEPIVSQMSDSNNKSENSLIKSEETITSTTRIEEQPSPVLSQTEQQVRSKESKLLPKLMSCPEIPQTLSEEKLREALNAHNVFTETKEFVKLLGVAGLKNVNNAAKFIGDNKTEIESLIA